MKTYIYILIDPITQHVRYVGKTNKPRSRFNEHISKCSKYNNYKDNWLNSLKKKGLAPEMVIIDETLDEDWEFLEQWYIELFRSWGFKLTNAAKGGKGGAGIVSREHAKKVSVKLQGLKRSPEFCKKVSEAMKNRII